MENLLYHMDDIKPFLMARHPQPMHLAFRPASGYGIVPIIIGQVHGKPVSEMKQRQIVNHHARQCSIDEFQLPLVVILLVCN